MAQGAGRKFLLPRPGANVRSEDPHARSSRDERLPRNSGKTPRPTSCIAWPDTANCIPLAKTISTNETPNTTCIWVNTYGKARVFGTTLGHANKTVSTDTYLDLVTRGLLWACGKLDDDGKPAAGYGKK